MFLDWYESIYIIGILHTENGKLKYIYWTLEGRVDLMKYRHLHAYTC